MKKTSAREYVVRIDILVEVARRQIDEILSSLEPGEFVTAHVRYKSVLLDRLATFGFALLMVVEDPRVVLSTFAHYVREEPSHIQRTVFAGMSMEDAYLAALDGLTHERASLQPLSARCSALNQWLESAAKQKELTGFAMRVSGCAGTRCPTGGPWSFGPGTHTLREDSRIDSWEEETPSSVMPIIESQLHSILDEWEW